MKHTVDELSETVHHYYTRGMTNEDPRRRQTEEYRRLSAARRQAGLDRERWSALLQHLHARFPDCIPSDGSLHLPTGDFDACYSGELRLPGAPGERPRAVVFLISFLVPYYVVYSARTEELVQREPLPGADRYLTFYGKDTMYVLRNRWWSRLIVKAAETASRIRRLRAQSPTDPVEGSGEEREKTQPTRRVTSFELSSADQPYAVWIAGEIEAMWGFAPMPPEVGSVVVPDVATNFRSPGKATLYDCLFLDTW